MARTKGSKNKSSVATELMEALNFVGMVAKSDNTNNPGYTYHVVLHGGFAITNNGQISAGHPIAEDLTCCPHFERFKSSINKCGKSLAMTQLDSGKLSVMGDKLRAVVDCLDLNNFPYTSPDANIAIIDDRLKAAFAVVGAIVSETGNRMVECAVLLEANQCTATDGKVLMQYWHGIDLPPNLIIPKLFASYVGRVKSPLVGFGFSANSVTFYFENGAWLKTQLYEDEYPSAQVAQIMSQTFVAEPVTAEFFEAIASVGEHNPDGTVIMKENKITSHNTDDVGAQYALQGVAAGLAFDCEQVKRIAGSVTAIDLTSYAERAYFQGENMRGVIMGVRLNKEPVGVSVREPEQAYRDEVAAPKLDANGFDPNDDVPF